MFERLGKFVNRAPIPIVLCWFIVGGLAIATAPDWSEVSKGGEFAFLPDDALSKRAETVYREAFPASPAEPGESDEKSGFVRQNPLGSTVAIVVQREDLPGVGLTAADFAFVNNVLRPGLEAIKLTTSSGFADTDDPVQYVTGVVRPVIVDLSSATRELSTEPVREKVAEVVDGKSAEGPLPESDQIIASVWTREEKGIGRLLTSDDRKSTLVVVELSTEFLERANGLALGRIEAFVNDVINNRTSYPESLRIPANLELAISGSATVGRDMLQAERESTHNTELYTKVLVIVLLLVIYRAPLLVVIPLITVGLTVEMSLALLRHMAGLGWIGVFSGLGIYVTVVVYGAGVDFCLFLISRYKEELDAGATFDDAIVAAGSRVGIALATSAGTSIAGIAMMMFAEFKKFPEAGFGISFGLFIVLCCVLTLTPALIRLSGRWAFWPDVRRERLSPQEGWIPTSGGWAALIREQQWTRRTWDWIAGVIARRPGTVFLTSVVLMAPFAAIALMNYNRLSYGLLSELRPTVTSVVGANAVQEHFSAGITGVTTILLQNEGFAFDSTGRLSVGERVARAITEDLHNQAQVLGLDDVRSQSHPLGTGSVAEDARGEMSPLERGLLRRVAQKTYLSTSGPLAGNVMRIDLVFNNDPFTSASVDQLTRAEQAVREALVRMGVSADPEELGDDVELYRQLPEKTRILTLGPTANIRDLKTVTDRDRVTIAVLVSIAVYLVLITLLGRPAISLYLVATVVFSFLVTMGVTHAFYWLIRDPAVGYTGVDWKAPIFVFTILVAMGEDYNVLLMARVDEEQRKHGSVQGVLVALTRTGTIISSCGVIMAGTFASLMTGTLMGIIQLGFALSFGVLLDTFVVRPILVPSYLVLLYQGRFGKLGRFLGYRETSSSGMPPTESKPEPDGTATPGHTS
jgi:RND superfamily putative drug exporter